MNTPHAAELLRCGCRINPESGDVFSHCARHACYAVVRFDEIERRKCPFCASNRVALSPAGLHLDCQDCGCRFPAKVEK